MRIKCQRKLRIKLWYGIIKAIGAGDQMRALSIICLLFLGNCAAQEAAPKLAWQHYDECADTTSSFVAMVDCGKQKRAAYCQTIGDRCGGNGASVVAYADSLATSLMRREILEPEARRKWIEFRMTQANAYGQREISEAAVRAALIAGMGR